MKAGWAETLLPKGFWNMPAYTSAGREARAKAQGFPISPYVVALEDMDAGEKLRGDDASAAKQ
jgi:hypothetical protein